MPIEDLDDLLHRSYRFALSLTHDSVRAEDLVQDALVAAIGAGSSWGRAYLFTIIRHRFVDQFRREGVRMARPLEDADALPASAEESPSDWDEELTALNGALDEALKQLRPEERGVLYLAAVEQYTAREIAELMVWPRSTVLSLIRRARAKLRRHITHNRSGDGS